MLPYGRKNPLPFPFSQRSHVGNLRQTLQGKGVIHKRVETAGVYPLVRPRGVSADSVCFASNYPMFHVKQNPPFCGTKVFHVKHQLFACGILIVSVIPSSFSCRSTVAPIPASTITPTARLSVFRKKRTSLISRTTLSLAAVPLTPDAFSAPAPPPHRDKLPAAAVIHSRVPPDQVTYFLSCNR